MSELLERLASEMGASERAWSAEEIARRFLRLTGSGPASLTLVRAILSKDPRFREVDAGRWEIGAVSAEPLLAAPLQLVHLEGREIDSVRVHFGGWSAGSLRSDSSFLDTTDPGRWIGRAGDLIGPRWVTLQPSLVARWIRRMDQLWAFGELDPGPIDLQSWIHLVLLEEGVPGNELRTESVPERLSVRWGMGSFRADGPGVLAWMGACLDRLHEVHPEWTEADLEKARSERLEPRPLDWSRFLFPESSLAELPESPGVYRLLGEADEVLYVGKAANLGRRLREHFRSLPAEPTRREEMLSQVRRFEFEETASEIEALVREHRLIGSLEPRWNVQVEVHPPRRFPPDWRWPLVYAAPEAGAARTVVLLPEPDRGLLFHLPAANRDGEEHAPSPLDLGPWLLALESGDLGGRSDLAPSGLIELTPPQAWLALRYFVRFRDQIDRIDPLSLGGPEALGARIRELADGSAPEGTRELR